MSRVIVERTLEESGDQYDKVNISFEDGAKALEQAGLTVVRYDYYYHPRSAWFLSELGLPTSVAVAFLNSLKTL